MAGAVAALAAGASALRLADLAGQPGGLYPDEAAEGLDAHRLLHVAGFHPVFFHDDAGREALFGYLVAGAFRIAGESPIVLRAVAALLGVLGVLALIAALARFGAGAALAGGAWAAGSLWLICVARDGFRVILVPLAGALALAALIRWGDRPGRGRALVAGAALAAGLWTYQPLKLLPLLAAVWLAWLARVDRDRFRALRAGLAPAAIAFAIIAAPMIAAAATDPGNYFGRGASVTALNPRRGVAALPVHVVRTLGMFAITGDPNPRHDVDALPLLGPVLLVLAAAGAIHCWRRRRDPAASLVLLGTIVFLIPPLVATEGGTPHFLRSLGLAPFVGALIGLGCIEITAWARARGGARSAAAAAAGLGLLLVVMGTASARAYFTRPVAERYDAYSFDLVALAAEGRGGPSTAVVVDDFAAFDVRFLDAANPPTIVDPSSVIRRPAAFRRIVSRDRRELARVAGDAVAAAATVVASDPAGRPAVWAAAP